MAARRPVSLKVRALQWLAQREYSRAELRQRLLRAARAPSPGADTLAAEGKAPESGEPDGPEPEVDALLDWLEAHRYLSDGRFVESRIQVRAARFGNLRIESELRRHGVALAPQDRETLRASEYERAHEVWRRKYGQAPADAATRLRQMRFLVGRGFSPEVVRRVVKGAGPDED